jgi:hypothetical protein
VARESYQAKKPGYPVGTEGRKGKRMGVRGDSCAKSGLASPGSETLPSLGPGGVSGLQP